MPQYQQGTNIKLGRRKGMPSYEEASSRQRKR